MLVLHNLNASVFLQSGGTVPKSWLGNKPQRKKLGADGTKILKCSRKKQMIAWI
jgi:hypothetical protein